MRFRLRLFTAEEYKPLRLLPPLMWPLTLGALAAQVAFSVYLLPPPEVRQRDYETPPAETMFHILALGEPETLAKLLALRLQLFDNQPGVSVPFAELDYGKLGEWLDRVVALDERAEYPHFLMAKIYSAVNDNSRRRQAVAWVRRQFLRRPDERWWWMVHSTNLAKHFIKDDALALDMARDLREHLTPGKTPSWPRQMEAFFLENKSEYDAAVGILLNQLEAGEIDDPQEFVFLVERLEKIVDKMVKKGEITSERELNDKLNTLKELSERFSEQFEREE